jgi:hypothetical protein
MSSDLYERDYYAWTQQQAAALRARRGGDNTLDFDNLAEEVEDLGRSQRRACRSQIVNILEHLLKIEFVEGPAKHWASEVLVFRRELEDDLSPTLRSQLPDELAGLYENARNILSAKLAAQSLPDRLPRTSPYAWEDVLGRGENWIPPAWGAPDSRLL